MNESDLVWLIWDDTPGAFFRVDRIFEDANDARAYIKGKPYLRGESQTFVRHHQTKEIESACERGMNEISAHEAGLATCE